MEEEKSKASFGALLKEGGGSAAPYNVTMHGVTRSVKVAKKERLTTLEDVSLTIKPGTMTLVLGAPGCGKTTLFRTLANHHARKEKMGGEVLFNGLPANRRLHHKSVAYVTQEDTHFPTLTVRETLQFALDCQAPSDMPAEARQKRVDMILTLLDLKHVETTFVGNELIRGISGGQKKRVTIGVSLTSSPSIILMDEPTTGLDANTALEVMGSMRSLCDNLRTPVVAALLQPSPEICNLFDNLLILSKGKVAYFGPYKNAIPYFARLGLVSEKFQSDPEFLQEAVEYSHRYSDKTPEQMIALYRESQEYRELLGELEEAKKTRPTPNGGAGLGDLPSIVCGPNGTKKFEKGDEEEEETVYPISFVEQVRLNMSRDVTMTSRDRAALRGRFMKKVIMGLVAGSLFFNLPDEQAGLRTRLAVLFFANLFLAFGNVGIITPFYRDRSVFYVQRENKYYSPAAYFLSKTLLELPIILVECVVFACIIYWMVGLNAEANRFIYFILVLMGSDLFAIVFCRFASTFISTEQVAAGMVPAVFGTMVMFTGFVIPPNSIPDWWIWIYYLSPFHYALEGVMINELVGSKYHCKASERVPPPMIPNFNLSYPDGYEGNSVCPITRGEQHLDNLGMHTQFYWRWLHLLILVCFSLFFIGLTFLGGYKIHHSTRVQQRKEIEPPKSSVQMEVKAEGASKAQVKQGANMSWENLSYAVDVKVGKKTEKLTLLQGINGYVRPGMLMALMGPSGAGKSTLLDVLANRKTGGYTEGKILVNGAPRNQFFNRFSAYVEQQDMLMPLATVYETILFSAQTRLPQDLSKPEIEVRIKDTMQILDLDSIAGKYAGNLSMEQKKRVTIAVELVSDPQLLFLDEPTSGLDSQAATKVMEVITRVAQTGRAVICTIHQPSLAVFSCFDHLLLLKRGGKTVYFGPTGKDCTSVLEYFASIGWECEPKRNPADFILDAAAITSENQQLLKPGQEDPEEAFQGSQLKKEMETHINEVPPGLKEPHFHRKYASGFGRQLECNLRRSWATVRRRTQDLRARTMRSLMMGIIIGTLFLQLSHDQADAGNRFGLLFFVLIIMGTSANNAVPNIVGERAVFYREQASGSYRATSYLVALVTTELPVTLATSVLLSILVYWISGLQSSADHFFFFAWMVFVYGSTTMAFVMFLSLALPNGEIAQALVGVFTSVFSLFAGFIITRPNIPDYWIWMYYFNLMHYPLEAIVTNEMEGQKFHCPGGKGAVPVPIPSHNTTKLFCPITSGDDMLRVLDFSVDRKFEDMGIAIAFWAAMVLFCLLALRFIRHIKR